MASLVSTAGVSQAVQRHFTFCITNFAFVRLSIADCVFQSLKFRLCISNIADYVLLTVAVYRHTMSVRLFINKCVE